MGNLHNNLFALLICMYAFYKFPVKTNMVKLDQLVVKLESLWSKNWQWVKVDQLFANPTQPLYGVIWLDVKYIVLCRKRSLNVIRYLFQHLPYLLNLNKALTVLF